MGCKRVLFDCNYLASFHRPNVSLYSGGVKEVVEDGVITTNGMFAKQKNADHGLIGCDRWKTGLWRYCYGNGLRGGKCCANASRYLCQTGYRTITQSQSKEETIKLYVDITRIQVVPPHTLARQFLVFQITLWFMASVTWIICFLHCAKPNAGRSKYFHWSCFCYIFAWSAGDGRSFIMGSTSLDNAL